LSVLLLGGTPAMSVEELPYTVLKRVDRFEIREVPSYLHASTRVSGRFEDVGNEGFRRLFRYIAGENRDAREIPMTAPVEQIPYPVQAPDAVSSGEAWAIAFVLPPNFVLDKPPAPKDERIQVEQVPARRLAVVRYRGTWSRSRFDDELVALRHFIAEQGLVSVGQPVFSRFDPPFMPWFLRRNEIQIPVADPVPAIDPEAN
jgi:hypothetical protein